MLKRLAISILVTIAAAGVYGQSTPSYGDLTQVYNKRTDAYNLVWRADKIVQLVQGEMVIDSLFVAYGCYNATNAWLFSSDTLFIDTCFGSGSKWLEQEDWLYPYNEIWEVHIDTIQSIRDDTVSYHLECDTGLFISTDDDIVHIDRTLYPNYIALTGFSAYYYDIGDTIVSYTCADYSICDPPPPPQYLDTIFCCNEIQYNYFFVDSIDYVDDTVFYYGSYSLFTCGHTIPDGCYPEITHYIIDQDCWVVVDSLNNLPVVVNDKLKVTDSIYVLLSKIPVLQPGEPISDQVLVLRKLPGDERQLARTSIDNLLDTLYSYGLDTTHWTKTGNYLYPKALTDSVGIGTDTPRVLMEIAADLKVVDTIFIGGGKFWIDSSDVFMSSNGNIAIGNEYNGNDYPLNQTTTGYGNIAIGSGAMASNLDGTLNIGIGTNALYLNTGGLENIALGGTALQSNVDGDANIAIGMGALVASTTADGNIAIGTEAFAANETGVGNIVIGWGAGTTSVTDADSCIFIGNESGQNETGSNKLYIENSNSATPLIWGDFAEDSLRFHGGVAFTGDISYEDAFWDDLTFPATTTKIGSNSRPDFDFDDIGLLFPYSDSTEITYYIAQLPHSFIGGSIYPYVRYIQPGEDDTAEFIMLYKWTDMGEAESSTWTRLETTNNTVFDYVSGNHHQLAAFPAIDGSDKTYSSVLSVKLYRKEDVGLNGEILMKDFGIHFPISRPGSDNPYD